MRKYSATHLSDAQVLRELADKVTGIRIHEAELLVLIAEADYRKLYLPQGYPSMHAYCIEHFHFSKDVAFKRIHAARAARQFPVLYRAVEDGRLHLSGVRLIAPHLTPENVDELVAAATHRTCEEIEEMVSRRFVRLETMLEAPFPAPLIPTPMSDPALMIPQQAARPVAGPSLELGQLASGPELVAASATPKPEPAIWVALHKRVHEKLQYARALLGTDASMVMERALDDLIAKAEKQKFSATANPRPPRPSRRPRYVAAQVRRAVWERDGGQCTYVSPDGKRCEARAHLEFDHIHPVARGGAATVEGMRLRCRAHNQFAAEEAFGAGFMQKKREEARRLRSGRIVRRRALERGVARPREPMG